MSSLRRSVVEIGRGYAAVLALDEPSAAAIGDRFYMVVDGELDVSVRGEPVGVRGAGDHVGELALLRDAPRTATVQARSDARLYALGREEFLGALTNHAAGRVAGKTATHVRPATLAAEVPQES